MKLAYLYNRYALILYYIVIFSALTVAGVISISTLLISLAIGAIILEIVMIFIDLFAKRAESASQEANLDKPQ